MMPSIILHLGLGSFHRAHQAVYLQNLHDLGDHEWELAAANIRGDMQAVIRAILTDTEARSDASLSSATAGKLREPIMRLTGWARAYGATSPSNGWAIGDTSSTTSRLGQSPGRSPTVFNFFRPGYTPPATAISAQAHTWWERFGFRPFAPDEPDQLDLYLLAAEIEATLRKIR